MRRANLNLTVSYAILGLAALAILLPLYSILVVAISPQSAPAIGLGLPADPQWSNFAAAWAQGNFGVLIKNSTVIAVSVVAVAVVFSVLSGFAFSMMEFPGKRLLFLPLLVGLVLPFEAVILPLYYNLRALGLTDSPLGVILPEVGLYVAFGTLWMRAVFAGVSREIVEAARIDGANAMQLLWIVLIPMCRPAITTLVVLFFLWSWNEFLVSLVILQDPLQRTAPAGLGAFVGEYLTNVPLLAAGAIYVALPVVIVYFFLQRYIIEGLTQGAVKG
ncbi:carbohydrate ABC transporter permease [Poseidonocella sp. HB161398]|uniref:carbohydrate ABC transporter permease n=1 Tax=Poseidonocella sp. HB161398 TaxID=2320855 RepID=UPI0011098D5A|nr:carbohydrate ABC transporter permease [Poseidonocella sp. HB161398]